MVFSLNPHCAQFCHNIQKERGHVTTLPKELKFPYLETLTPWNSFLRYQEFLSTFTYRSIIQGCDKLEDNMMINSRDEMSVIN